MQSPLSSPHVSPSTSHYSSRSASPWSPSTGKFDISAWLKQARLHKYQEGLDGYTLEEVTVITFELREHFSSRSQGFCQD